MKCKCGQKMKLKKDMFFYRGTYCKGWVCKDCNALYATKTKNIFELAIRKNFPK